MHHIAVFEKLHAWQWREAYTPTTASAGTGRPVLVPIAVASFIRHPTATSPDLDVS